MKTFQGQDHGISDSSPTAVSAKNPLVILLLGRIQSCRQNCHHAPPTARQYSSRQLGSRFRLRRWLASRQLSFLQSYVVGQKLPASLAPRNPIDILTKLQIPLLSVLHLGPSPFLEEDSAYRLTRLSARYSPCSADCSRTFRADYRPELVDTARTTR